ncbi:nitric oxide-inducible protein [Elysia marginata]|uniref:Nitric oxide-inducible protein n=1 Tax=Elysia marginata TaxID=1093978 RepID=A0AAV4HGH5_9GAST|nr:nitric oxide-inducible protein [Elysia marginata]
MTGRSSRVLLAATVTEIGCGPYVYPACPQCYCKLTQLETSHLSRCPKCSSVYKPEDIYYRFRLCATITDFLSTANITAFGGMLDVFFGVTASKLNQKILGLDEKYYSLSEELVKLAIEQTFVGQSLLFGFKVNPLVLKKSVSQLPRQQVLLSDVVNDSLTTKFQADNSSAQKIRSDLIAVQIALQGKPNQNFRTVSDGLCELVRYIEERYKTLAEPLDKANLRNVVNFLYTKGTAALATSPAQSVSPLVCERSQTESVCSNSSLLSESELSSIRLSCDSSVQKIKRMYRKTRSLLDITNLDVAVSTSPTKKSSKDLQSLMMSVENNQEANEHCVRRSKRILERKGNRKDVFSNKSTFSKANQNSENKGKKRKNRCATKLHDVSPKGNVTTQKGLSSGLSCSSPYDISDQEMYSKTPVIICSVRSELESYEIKTQNQTLGRELREPSLLDSINNLNDNAPLVLPQIENQSLYLCEDKKGKNIDCDTLLRSLKNSVTKLNPVTLHQETSSQGEKIFRKVSQFKLVNNLSLSASPADSDSDMDVTKNLPSQIEPSLCNVSDAEKNSSILKKFGCRINQTTKPSDSHLKCVLEEFPESENLNDFLKAGPFHFKASEKETNQINCFNHDKIKVKKNVGTWQSTQGKTETSQEYVNYISYEILAKEKKNSCDCSEEWPQLDHISFANVTNRRESKHKRNKPELRENNLELSPNLPILDRAQKLLNEHFVCANVTTAPESEDIYDFFGGVGLTSQQAQSLRRKSNENVTLPSPETNRVYCTPTPCGPGEESIHISKLENSFSISEESKKSLDASTNADFETASRNSKGYKPTGEQKDEQQVILPAGIYMNKNDSLKWSGDKHQLAVQEVNSSTDYSISFNHELVDECNLECMNPPLIYHLKNCTQLAQNDSESLQNSKKDFTISNPLSVGMRTMNPLIGCAHGSPQLDASFDLFDNSCVTPSSMQEQCCRSQNSHESIGHLKKFFSESFFNSSVSTPTTGNRKVRFKKRRKEIFFHDFEIISHLPVPNPKRKNLKSCLKKQQSAQEIDVSNCHSQDLFESPIQAATSKSLQVSMVSKCDASIVNHQGNPSKMDPTCAFGQSPLFFSHDGSGSQELFSSEDPDSSHPQSSKSELPEEMNFSHGLKASTGQSIPSIQHTVEQTLSSNIWTLSQGYRETNRDSLDLFSPSTSQNFC